MALSFSSSLSRVVEKQTLGGLVIFFFQKKKKETPMPIPFASIVDLNAHH